MTYRTTDMHGLPVEVGRDGATVTVKIGRCLAEVEADVAATLAVELDFAQTGAREGES